MADSLEKQAAAREYENDVRNRAGVSQAQSLPDSPPPGAEAPYEVTNERLIMGVAYGLAMGVCGIGKRRRSRKKMLLISFIFNAIRFMLFN